MAVVGWRWRYCWRWSAYRAAVHSGRLALVPSPCATPIRGAAIATGRKAHSSGAGSRAAIGINIGIGAFTLAAGPADAAGDSSRTQTGVARRAATTGGRNPASAKTGSTEPTARHRQTCSGTASRRQAGGSAQTRPTGETTEKGHNAAGQTSCGSTANAEASPTDSSHCIEPDSPAPGAQWPSWRHSRRRCAHPAGQRRPARSDRQSRSPDPAPGSDRGAQQAGQSQRYPVAGRLLHRRMDAESRADRGNEFSKHRPDPEFDDRSGAGCHYSR